MKKVLLILSIFTLFVACAKENKIERNLWKKGSEWNIESWEITHINDQFPEQNYTEVVLNKKLLQFNKCGSGSLTF